MNNDFKNNEGNIADHNADYARTTIKNILYKKIAFLIK
jgi:major membrane immunogen (membrane-anchored lipoprotein)